MTNLLDWKPDPDRHGHFVAVTAFGTYNIGPRRSDGWWEYRTPDDEWGDHDNHIFDNLSREEAFASVEAEYQARAAIAAGETR